MCGICGFFSKEHIDEEQLKLMNDTMYHRGPNDSGVELYAVSEGYTLGLAHRRLSIMDLSELGHQPMHSYDKRISLVFNGEIYNFMEIREMIPEYDFKSHCDTEVIIAAYLKWGIKCVDKFNGMFAIALYDREIDTLFLVRDRMGKKPLYYWLDAGNIIFASELKPIMKAPGFKKSIRTDIIPRYLYHQYIVAPDTVFRNVFKLEPGECYAFHDGVGKKWKYWDVATVYHEKKDRFVGDFNDAKTDLNSLLREAVRLRMISDVPLGAFLSGGYDSSLVTAVAQSISSNPVNTFSIGFKEKAYNESVYARNVADYLGTNHVEMIIDETEMIELVDSIPEYYDEPFADSSQIPSMLVAKLAKQDVTVVLSGDGGDELFCGYNNYELVKKAQLYDSVGGFIMYLKETLPKLGDILYQKLPSSVRTVAENRNRNTKTQFGSSGYYNCCKNMLTDKKTKTIDYETEPLYKVENWQIIRMLLDMDTYLPEDILCKVDRATMKYSLEARCPILDKNVVEFSYSLPHEFKYKNGIKKRLLKELAYDYIPKSLLDRPKVGFGVPLDKWLRGPLKDQVMEYSSESFLKKQEIFDFRYIKGFMSQYMLHDDAGAGTGNNYSKFVWSFLVFQKWYDKYMCI